MSPRVEDRPLQGLATHKAGMAKYLRIVAPHFVAGIEPGNYGRTAPILMWMLKRNWSFTQIHRYCKIKGWVAEEYEDGC